MLWHLVDLTAAGLEVELTYCSNDRETKARKNATSHSGRRGGGGCGGKLLLSRRLQSCARKSLSSGQELHRTHWEGVFCSVMEQACKRLLH